MNSTQKRWLRELAKDGICWHIGDKGHAWLERVTGFRIQREHGLNEDSSASALFQNDMEGLRAKCRELLAASLSTEVKG